MSNTVKCKLCLQNKKLVKSHIISEFLYKPLYFGKHKLLYIPTDKSQPVLKHQKGIRERLLCEKCDNRIGKYEKYAREFLFGGNIKVNMNRNDDLCSILSGLNYEYLKLFQLSILWRSSISELDFFSVVNLGSHENKIRTMIHNGHPGEPHQYGCVLLLITTENGLFDCVSQPSFFKFDGHPCYRFIMGGLAWHYIVSSHSHRFSLKQFFLEKNGGYCILKDKFSNLEFLKNEIPKLSERKDDVLKRIFPRKRKK